MDSPQKRLVSIARTVAVLTLAILAIPLLAGMVADDDCCHKLAGCDYLSCDCNCHMIAGPILVPDHSALIGATAYLSAPAPSVPAEDFPRGTDRPPRLTA